MLTAQQFFAKHPVKYNGLSAQQKRKRYQDYVRSQRGNTSGQGGSVGTQQGSRRAGGSSQIQRARGGGQGVSDPAAMAYFNLFKNPFTADTVGLPMFPAPPSTKVTSWARGTLLIGTGGFGFAAVVPTAASDAQGVFYSGSTYAGTTIANSGTGVLNTMFTNLPYAASSFSEIGIRCRFLCVAIRVRYIGPEQNKSGVMAPHVSPTHTSILGYTLATIQSQENFVSCATSRDWCTAVLSPITRIELDYRHNHLYPLDHMEHPDQGQGNPIMGVFVGGAAAGTAFEWEVVQHIEMISANAQMTRTANDVSSSGAMDRIINNLSYYANRVPGSRFQQLAAGAAVGVVAASRYTDRRRAIRDEL